MPLHILMILMIIGGLSLFTYAQETPAPAPAEAAEEMTIKKVTPTDLGPVEQAPEEPTPAQPVAPAIATEPTKEQASTPATAPATATPTPATEGKQPSAQEKTIPAATADKQPAEETLHIVKPTTVTEPKESEPAADQEQPAEAVATEKAEMPAGTEAPESLVEVKPAPASEQANIEPAAEDEINLLTIPAPIEEQEVIIPEEIIEEEFIEEEAPAGIDTVSLENPQGNWLFKRIWWERAEERYEKIRILVDTVWNLRTKFFIMRNDLDRNVLDPFYITVGIDQGELEAILAEINEFLEKQSEQQENLTDAERILYQDYVAQEETLKHLKNDVDIIGKLDRAIDQALGTLMEQINRVRQYETDSWNSFKEIAHILNDTKARELYYMIEGAARNIKNINTYLEREFFTHFNKLVGDITQRVNRVQNQIEALKEKGIRFQHQTEILEEQKQQAAATEEQQEEEEEEAPKPKLGWFAWIGSFFSKTFDYIFSIIRMPYDMIFGK